MLHRSIHPLLLSEDTPITLLVDNVGVSFVRADNTHSAIIVHIQFIVVSDFGTIEHAIKGKIFCHVSITVNGFLFMFNLWMTFMYHVCMGHIPTLVNKAVVQAQLVIVGSASLDTLINNTVEAITCMR